MVFPEGGRVGVVGTDGRSDAIATACRAAVGRERVFGIAELRIPGLEANCAELEVVAALGPAEIETWARRVAPTLVIVGPEAPLAAGVVDTLEGLGIRCFGPTQALAQIESSKIWTRRLLEASGIPGNPAFRVFTSADGLREHLEAMGEFVIKPDGLTGGKGVRLHPEHFGALDEALAYATECIAGSPLGHVLIEERLDGEEFSLMTITDGVTSAHCPAVQDHKRADVGDVGPNTGGMGSYSCDDLSLPFLTPADVAAARAINEQVIATLHETTGHPYRGVLYGGFIATADGVRLIEYNARFGDPESLNVLPILETDFVELAWAAATGALGVLGPVRFAPRATVCKYLVPASYPAAKLEVGAEVVVPPAVTDDPDVRVFWAACEQRDGAARLTGSRSLAVVGIGATLKEAEALAEDAAGQIEGPVRHRADIGTEALVARRVEHMRILRG